MPLFEEHIGQLARTLLALALLSLLGTANALAARAHTGAFFYVATTGNDSNPGTSGAPWRTIQKAANTLVAGDTVYIRSGTYAELVQAKNSGAAGANITFTAEPGAVVTLDGAGIVISNGLDGLFSIEGKSYVEVSNLRIVNSRGAGIRVDSLNGTPSTYIVLARNYTFNTVSSGVGVWNSNHVTVDGNEIVLANNDGSQENLTIAQTDTFEVKHNHVHHSGPGTNGGEGIDIKDGSSNGLVYANEVDHIHNRVGLLVDAWDKHEFNVQIFQNRLHENADYGISIGSEAGGLLENVRVYNNLIYSNFGHGLTIRPDGISATHPLKDITVINNTFANNGPTWGGGIYVTNPQVQNLVLRNNLLSQNLEFQIVVSSTVPTAQVAIDHNLIDGFRGHPDETFGMAYVTGNPRFYSPGYDWHLLAGSPAITAGSPTGAPITDYDGILRPLSGIDNQFPEIGAYQFMPNPVIQWLFLPLLLRTGSK